MANEDNRPKPTINDQIALYVLHERVNELREAHRQKDDRDLRLFQQLADAQKSTSERLAVVETNDIHVSHAVIKLQKESSIQTKLLTGIFLSAISALITIIVKAILG